MKVVEGDGAGDEGVGGVVVEGGGGGVVPLSPINPRNLSPSSYLLLFKKKI